VIAAETCALCGLKIESPPVVQSFDGAEKRFCCQGCARVYEVAHDSGMLGQLLVKPAPKSARAPEFFLDSGQTAHFALDGMWCAGCALAAERLLSSQRGVISVDVSFAAERGRVRYDPAQIDPAMALRSLNAMGYEARLLTDRVEDRRTRQQERVLLQLLTAAGFGMQIMILYLVQLYPRYAAGGFSAPDVRKLEVLVWVLATPVVFIGGSSFLLGAWRALRGRSATMDTLVALGTLSAYGYSVYVTLTGNGAAYFDSVAMITTFVMLGRYLETLGGAQARKDIRSLLRGHPPQGGLHDLRAGPG
jgi:cation transport ATPase